MPKQDPHHPHPAEPLPAPAGSPQASPPLERAGPGAPEADAPGLDHDQLRAENQALRDLLRAAQADGRLALWERDRVSGQGRWEDEVFQLLGLPADAPPPSVAEATAMIDERDRERVRQAWDASLARPGLHSQAYRMQRADGQRVQVRSTWCVPAHGARIHGFIVDEAGSRENQRQRDLARQQIEQVAGLVGLFVWRRDDRWHRYHVDEQVWAASDHDDGGGLAREEFLALWHPDDAHFEIGAEQAAAMGDDPVVAEMRLRMPQGPGYRTMLTRRVIQRDADGAAIGVLGVGVDITEQVHARERLRQLLERMDLVVGAAGVGVWTVDPRDNVQTWNEAMCAIYGLSAQEAPLAERIAQATEFVLAEDRPRVEQALRAALAEPGRSIDVDYRIRRRDGEVRSLTGRARMLTGDSRLLCGIVIDTTDTQRAAQALRDRDAAERADQAKSAFLSRVSHELRTPLNAVIGFSDLLLTDQGRTPEATRREWLEMVRDAGRHLLSLVDDLLSIGREGATPDAGERMGCELAPVVAKALAWQDEAAARAGVRLRQTGQAPAAAGSDRHWRQIVSNLLSNAIKFNRPGGEVVIALGTETGTGWATLCVRDDGRGLDAAQQAQAFQPFNRLGAERDGIPGTGLGLSIVHQLVRALGGEITLHSVAGKGTEVCIRVPPAEAGVATSTAHAGGAPTQVAEAAADTAAAAAPGPAAPGPAVAASAAPRIVYVEDNAVNVMLVRDILAAHPGLGPLAVAGSVQQALELLADVRPVLLLVDMHLPDGSGLDLLAALRERDSGRGGARAATHVVALSADVMPEEVERARRGGFDDYWAKPIDVAAFVANVRRLLASSG